jgi:hypothetical protein
MAVVWGCLELCKELNNVGVVEMVGDCSMGNPGVGIVKADESLRFDLGISIVTRFVELESAFLRGVVGKKA